MLHDELATLGIELGVTAQTQVIEHLQWVLDENTRVNLTAIKSPNEAVRLHAVDSLTALEEVELAPAGPLLDIGTGGGFPGIPLAIASGRDTTLLDSVGKKCSAIAGFLDRAGLGDSVCVETARAEEFALRQRGKYSVVVMRAVSALPSIVELAAPLLSVSGVLVAMKARIDDDELRRGMKAGEIVGMVHAGTRTVVLPDGGEIRSIITFQRVGESSVPLPRRNGTAQKRPLA